MKGIAEILNEVKKAKSVNQKIKILHDHEATHGKEIKGIFELTYDNRLQWDLPEGNPPYKPLDKSMDCQGNLIQDMRRMPLFLKGLNNLQAMKREQLFVRMLEEIDPDDALLLLEAKSKKIKGISKKTVKQAYPGFLDDPANQDV